MKHFMRAAVICGCLLIGSMYPKMLLEHHVKLIDDRGREIAVEGDFQKEIPVKVEFRFLSFFR